MDDISHILVLCMGNICRSPMAESLLRRDLGESFHVESAGLGALVGQSADPLAVKVMDDLGLDLRPHRARQVDDSHLRRAQLVLVMDTAQKSETERTWPWTRGKVWRIGQWDRFDIPDPYRRPEQSFLQTRQLLETACRSWVAHLAPASVPCEDVRINACNHGLQEGPIK